MTYGPDSGHQPLVLAVTSHRGGSGKTTLAAGIAAHLAGLHEQRVLAVDVSPDGALAHVLSEPNLTIKPVDINNRSFLPLLPGTREGIRIVWAPGSIRNKSFWDFVMETARIHELNFVVVDLPIASTSELGDFLRRVWLMLLAVPCDGPSFRSLGPLLEGLNEERSRPGREFQVRAVMTMTGVPNPERQALEAFERQYLRPMLTRSDIPFDPELRRLMATQAMPIRGETIPAAGVGALAGLAGEIMDIAEHQNLSTPVG